MKILVITFYFRPDLSAGSFRATALVEALQRLAPPGSKIDVMTTLPNRYQSYSAGSAAVATQEEVGPVSIVRVPVAKHKSGFVDQAKAFRTFSKQVIANTRGHDYDVVFATSSRLMTAALAARIARKKRIPLYLDIRDIFVETITDILPRRAGWIATPTFSLLERWTINSAAKVNLVSPGFAPYFTGRYPERQFTYITNGVDDEFVAAFGATRHRAATIERARPITILYAGNLGEGQGMHLILPALARRAGTSMQFRVIGDGGRRAALEHALEVAEVTNVEVLPPVRREALVDAYREADVLFLHLNDYPAFERVLPSKLFEYAATGKPIWAGVAGFPATFIKSEIRNAAIFRPCDVDDAMEALAALRIEDESREEFVVKYSRSELSRELATAVLEAARDNG